MHFLTLRQQELNQFLSDYFVLNEFERIIEDGFFNTKVKSYLDRLSNDSIISLFKRFFASRTHLSVREIFFCINHAKFEEDEIKINNLLKKVSDFVVKDGVYYFLNTNNLSNLVKLNLQNSSNFAKRRGFISIKTALKKIGFSCNNFTLLENVMFSKMVFKYYERQNNNVVGLFEFNDFNIDLIKDFVNSETSKTLNLFKPNLKSAKQKIKELYRGKLDIEIVIKKFEDFLIKNNYPTMGINYGDLNKDNGSLIYLDDLYFTEITKVFIKIEIQKNYKIFK